MKKILFVLLILLLAFGGYLLYDNFFSGRIPRLDVEEEVVNIDKLYIYGSHLNIHGDMINDKNLDLVFYNGEFKNYDINEVEGKFLLSEKVNEGIPLEDFDSGTYYMFLRSSSKDEEDNDVYKYYVLNNTTKYEEMTYYTLSNKNKKIVINTDDDYKTLTFNVTENTDDNIYDIVIDPGHGGMDGGANVGSYKEADFTIKIANQLKEKLENKGFKVKLTREDGQLTNNEKLPDYGTNGRAVIAHNVGAKYLFSIHLNSNAYASVSGVEIYTPEDINYEFAKNLVNNIVSSTGSKYSSNKINKMFDGIYTRTFTEADIKSSLKEYEQRNMVAYDITTNSNYYYMIRENGGIVTGAYVDDRNSPKVPGNPYYDSNIGVEAYLLELAYLTNSNDLNNIINNMDKYTDSICDSIVNYLNY